jgi:hypothetical protein
LRKYCGITFTQTVFAAYAHKDSDSWLVGRNKFKYFMTTAGSFDAPIEIFGGLVTDMSPADLPHGVSPDCQDVLFSNGGVSTRPGLQALFGPLAGNTIPTAIFCGKHRA